MGVLTHLLGNIRRLVKGPVRKLVESKSKGLLESLSKAAFKRIPHTALSRDALASLQSTLQIQLPEWGSRLVGQGLASAADAVGDRLDAALA